MSERIYACLLSFYPAHFREAFGDEAMQLFRDRARDERGPLRKLRLWMDIAADLASSLPRAHSQAEQVLAGAPAPGLGEAPRFHVLEPASPRPGAIAYGGMLSALAFGLLLMWFGYGRNYRVLNTWQGPTKHDLYGRATGQPAQFASGRVATGNWRAPIAAAESEIEAPGRSARVVLSSWVSAAGPSGFQSAQLASPGGQATVEAQAAQPRVQDATAAMIEAIDAHKIVLFGEVHGNKQEYEWLCSLVKNRRFADGVDDIVVEFGNSLYQKSVDRYIAGEDVPIEQVQKAWRNTVGSFGPPSPVYGWFYKAVRESNLERRGGHQIRLLLCDPYGDWDKIKDAEDLGPYLAHRDEWYAQVVKDEVLARHHRALLIMGEGHFLRRHGPGLIEGEIRAAGADPYLVIFATNAVGGYDDLDKRFDSWKLPAIVPLAGNWVGALPAMPAVSGGLAPANPLKLADAADAIFYAGSRDVLTEVNMPPSELDGTPYGKELVRRMTIETGQTIEFTQRPEEPQFPPPHPQAGAAGRQALPPMPKSIHDPLPPRPPSQ